MSFLVDTDVVADYLNGRPSAVQILTELTPEYPAISIITFGEIYEGIYFGRNRQAAEQGFLAFLSEFDVLQLNTDIMKRFAMIRGDLRRTGQLVSDTDLMIAATALHYDLTLVTRNLRHFERVPGLKLFSAASG